MNTAVIEQYIAAAHRREYPKGQIVVHAGLEPDTLYYVLSGSVRVIAEDEEGHEMVLDYLGEGQFFGEMGLFDDIETRTAMVRCRSDCVLAEMSYARFRQLVDEDAQLLFMVSNQLASRLQATNARLCDLAFLDVAGQVAHILIKLSNLSDAEVVPGGRKIAITRQELSSIAGCSREMAGKVLKTLEQQNQIVLDGRDIVVLSRDKTPAAP